SEPAAATCNPRRNQPARQARRRRAKCPSRSRSGARGVTRLANPSMPRFGTGPFPHVPSSRTHADGAIRAGIVKAAPAVIPPAPTTGAGDVNTGAGDTARTRPKRLAVVVGTTLGYADKCARADHVHGTVAGVGAQARCLGRQTNVLVELVARRAAVSAGAVAVG